MKKAFILIGFVLLFAQVAAADVQDESLAYENSKMGIKLQGPPGWCLYQGMKKRPEVLAVFSKLPYTLNEKDNPTIVLFRRSAAKKGPDSPLAQAKRDVEVIGLMRNVKGVEWTRILDEPKETAIGGRDCAGFSYEIKVPHKKQAEDSKAIEYNFLKDGQFYVLFCGARSEFFDKYSGDFAQSVNSFILQ